MKCKCNCWYNNCNCNNYYYSLASAIPPGVTAKVASFSGRSGLSKKKRERGKIRFICSLFKNNLGLLYFLQATFQWMHARKKPILPKGVKTRGTT